MKKILIICLVVVLTLSGCSQREYDFNIENINIPSIEIPNFNQKEPKLEIEVEFMGTIPPQEENIEQIESEKETQPESTSEECPPVKDTQDEENKPTEPPVKEETKPATINLSNYNKKVSYSGLTSTEIDIVNALLKSDCETEEIDGKIYRVVKVDEHLSFSSYLQVNSFFVLRTSQWAFEEDMIDYYTDNVTTKVCFNIDMYEKYMSNRGSYDKKINSILEDFTEGDETHKLKQIAKYLKDNVTYNESLSDGINAIINGQGNCNAYALAFKDMASRLGIQCDLCIGTAKNGEAHSWNRVTLSNGEYRYYDVCWYDSSLGIGYVDMKNNPHGEFEINNYY